MYVYATTLVNTSAATRSIGRIVESIRVVRQPAGLTLRFAAILRQRRHVGLRQYNSSGGLENNLLQIALSFRYIWALPKFGHRRHFRHKILKNSKVFSTSTCSWTSGAIESNCSSTSKSCRFFKIPFRTWRFYVMKHYSLYAGRAYCWPSIERWWWRLRLEWVFQMPSGQPWSERFWR